MKAQSHHKSSARRPVLLIVLFGLIYALLTASVQNSYYQLIMAVVPIWAVMGLSWNILSGYSGYVSFGHAAFFGLGAYFVALAQIKLGMTPWVSIPIAGLIGGVAGLLVGLPTFRLRGHYFALAMLAYPLAFLYFFEWLGYQELALPMMRDEPLKYMQFEDTRMYAYIALVLMLAAMLLSSYIERSRFGLSLMAIKQDEAAAEAAGIDTLVWKLKAITLSGILAGTIGGLYAVVLLIVTPPAVFGMLVSAQALILAMFGGVATLWGPVIGAVVLVPLSEFLHARLGDVIPGIQGVVYGLAIVIVILLAPEGVFWKVKDLLRKRRAHSETAVVAAPTVVHALEQDATPSQRRPASTVVVFEARDVSKAFGGLKAVQHVSLKVMQGEVLGIIGPNGAGKTTFFNLLNGFIRPDSGEIILNGKNIVGKLPYQTCAAGVGRTFQVVRPFRRMSIAQNVIVGAYVHAKTDALAQEAATWAMEQVGLLDQADRLAGELSSKELRLLELARALAGKPKILLLDETLAGLGASEVEELITVIRQLAAQGMTIAIIEHTMQAMVRLVDRFVVLDHGAVLAEGSPDSITKNHAVIDAYLGKKWRAANA
jgi:ABC-type branched-subunit amino acid transport system ATPase component/ABC-type branched-subunit amino acid transport system permease subunit